MPYPVRCPVCRNATRVDAAVVGASIDCPKCDSPFRAVPEARVRSAVPTVIPTDGFDAGTTPRPTSFLLGLALLPFGLPFLWILARSVTNTEPMFSVLVAVAVAISTTGLGLGVAFAKDWSSGTRVKSILALVFLAYGAGGFLYFLKKEWVEVFRKQIGRGELEWREFHAPDKSYQVRMPGRTEPTESPLADWELRAFRVTEKNPLGTFDTFLVAHGNFPALLRPLKEDEWFEKVKQLVAPDDGGTLTAEKPIQLQGYRGREYRLVLPDGGTNRIVRVYRANNRVYYLLVEGASLPLDHADVKKFLDSFYLFEAGK